MHDLQLSVTSLTKAFDVNNYTLEEPIMEILYEAKKMSTHSTIAPPNMNRFG